MKRRIALLTSLLLCLTAYAQDDLLVRLQAANTFETLEAAFVQTRHSAVLSENLVSEGRVILMAPDHLRWEVTKPYRSVFVSEGEVAVRGRRFRLPALKDFTATVLEGEDYAVRLEPVRRDLKSLFREIILHADRKTLRVCSALLVTPDGDWTNLEFKDVRVNGSVDPSLFKTDGNAAR